MNEIPNQQPIDQHTVDTLDAQIKAALKRTADTQIPSDLNGWPRMHNYLNTRSAPHKPHTKPRFVIVANAAVIAVILAILAFVVTSFVRPQQSISAAEILHEAVRVQKDASAGQIKSFKGIVITHWADNPNGSDLEIHLWRSYPLKMRKEIYANYVENERLSTASLSTPVNAALKLSYIGIYNGIEQTFYHEGDLVPTQSNILLGDAELDMVGLQANIRPTDKTSIEQALNNEKTAVIKLVGTETVADRIVYILELPKNGWTIYDEKAVRDVVYIDQQTYFQLGEAWYDANNTVIHEWKFSNIEFNVPIEDSVFRLKVPGLLKLNTELQLRIPVTPTPLATSEGLQQMRTSLGAEPVQGDLINKTNYPILLSKAAQLADFKVFAPPDYNALPDLYPAPPLYDASQDGLVILKYQTIGNPLALVIVEGKSDVMQQYNPCKLADAVCTEVTVGVEKGQFWQHGEVKWLVFDHEGTMVFIRSESNETTAGNGIDKETMISVATTLEPVDKVSTDK